MDSHARLRLVAGAAEHLPDEMPHVRLAAAGVIEDLTSTLTHWVPGTMLSHGWADLDRTQRRTAAEQLGHALRALHAWEASPEVRAALAARPAQPDTSDVIGADLNPLPVDRALRLVEPRRTSRTSTSSSSCSSARRSNAFGQSTR